MPLNGLAFCEATDRDLESRISNFLCHQYRQALSALEIEARNGDVTLRGQVSTYYEKQLAISCCRRVAGVLSVDCSVDVIGA